MYMLLLHFLWIQKNTDNILKDIFNKILNTQVKINLLLTEISFYIIFKFHTKFFLLIA